MITGFHTLNSFSNTNTVGERLFPIGGGGPVEDPWYPIDLSKRQPYNYVSWTTLGEPLSSARTQLVTDFDLSATLPNGTDPEIDELICFETTHADTPSTLSVTARIGTTNEFHEDRFISSRLSRVSFNLNTHWVPFYPELEFGGFGLINNYPLPDNDVFATGSSGIDGVTGTELLSVVVTTDLTATNASMHTWPLFHTFSLQDLKAQDIRSLPLAQFTDATIRVGFIMEWDRLGLAKPSQLFVEDDDHDDINANANIDWNIQDHQVPSV